ncbi:uncharacterized protein EI90DRAFT_3292946 [Cantharellus anzutake]|uniref:uncharacterized protein n=1 Tax=Cantharellus anzutake TaxID=1750568 RepID=UPI0019060999|nr:uncharacterized protein EI90DRAFT_3292946 [Cantharellus anzutake]KAF8319902.1 hypothetical protein EI90DRAFT_3292946 [Cantharellus anzutake]
MEILMENFLPVACAEETITYNNTPIFLIGCYRLFSICKHPTGDSEIHPNSTTVVHEGQFSEAIEDDVEVMLEEVYEHLDTGTLADVNEFTVVVGSEVGSATGFYSTPDIGLAGLREKMPTSRVSVMRDWLLVMPVHTDEPHKHTVWLWTSMHQRITKRTTPEVKRLITLMSQILYQRAAQLIKESPLRKLETAGVLKNLTTGIWM